MRDQARAPAARYDGTTDDQLVAAAAGGDDSAFEQLVRRHGGVVLGLARRFLPRGLDADDLVQEVFIKIHRALAGFRGDASVKTWICQVTVNAARNRRRDEGRRLAALRPAAVPSAAPEDAPRPEDLVRDERPGPERLAASAQARQRIEAALAALPDEFREPLVLREIEGLSYDEIAKATGAELGTVKSRIARARLRLQDSLADLALGGQP